MTKKVDTGALVDGINRILMSLGEPVLSKADETDLRVSVAEIEADPNEQGLDEAQSAMIRKKVLTLLDPRKVDN